MVGFSDSAVAFDVTSNPSSAAANRLFLRNLLVIGSFEKQCPDPGDSKLEVGGRELYATASLCWLFIGDRCAFDLPQQLLCCLEVMSLEAFGV